MKNPFNKKEQESLFSGIQNELYSEREIITSFTENNVAPLMSESKPDPTQFLSTSSKIKHQKQLSKQNSNLKDSGRSTGGAPRKVTFELNQQYSSSEVQGSHENEQSRKIKIQDSGGFETKEQTDKIQKMEEMIEMAMVAQFKQSSTKIQQNSFITQPRQKTYYQKGSQLIEDKTYSKQDNNRIKFEINPKPMLLPDVKNYSKSVINISGNEMSGLVSKQPSDALIDQDNFKQHLEERGETKEICDFNDNSQDNSFEQLRQVSGEVSGNDDSKRISLKKQIKADMKAQAQFLNEDQNNQRVQQRSFYRQTSGAPIKNNKNEELIGNKTITMKIDNLNNLKQSINVGNKNVVDQKKSQFYEDGVGSGKKKIKNKDQAYVSIGESSEESYTNIVKDAYPIVKHNYSSSSDQDISQSIFSEKNGIGIVMVEDVDSPDNDQNQNNDQLPLFTNQQMKKQEPFIIVRQPSDDIQSMDPYVKARQSFLSGKNGQQDMVSNQLDSQIYKHEQYLQHLKQIRIEQERGRTGTVMATNELRITNGKTSVPMQEEHTAYLKMNPAISNSRNRGIDNSSIQTDSRIGISQFGDNDLDKDEINNRLSIQQYSQNLSIEPLNQYQKQLTGGILNLSHQQTTKILRNDLYQSSDALEIDDVRNRNTKSFSHALRPHQISLSPPRNMQARKSKIDQIKIEKKNTQQIEIQIRHFNLKLFDKVIQQLRKKDKIKNNNLNLEVINEEQEDQNLLQIQDSKRLGKFLYETVGLDKQNLGLYFGNNKLFNLMVLREFLRCFNFFKIPIEKCWRRIFDKTGLPPEGQQIVRVLTEFQMIYLEKNIQNPEVQDWDEDTVFLLSIKLMDLNTNLHNPNVKQMLKYSKETFIDQSMRFEPLKKSFTEEQLGEMYENILLNQFESKVNMQEKYFKRINELSHTLVKQRIDKFNEVQQDNLADSARGRNGSVNQWARSNKSIKIKLDQANQEKMAGIMKERHDLFVVNGTVFTKYGRYGNPKQRLVFLNEDETELCWKDRNKKDKPRKMLIKDVNYVRIGSDHTQIMKKQNIPPMYDNFVISIIGANRSLDLMIHDKKVIQMWCDKLSQLIDKQRSSKTESEKYLPSSPGSGEVGKEITMNLYQRDQCPGAIDYIWQIEILNNWQKYWNPMYKQVYHNIEIFFSDQVLRSAIEELIDENGGFFMTTFPEDQLKNDVVLGNRALIQNMRPINATNNGRRQQHTQSQTSIFSQLTCLQPNQKYSAQEAQTPRSMHNLMNLFKKDQKIITVKELWYRGLPNMSRYCLWPILIGNPLNINRCTFDLLREQSCRIQSQIDQLSQKQNEIQSSVYSPNQFKKDSLDINLIDVEFDDIDKTASFIAQDLLQKLDPYTKHMIEQFNKSKKKINKISEHWTKASIIGELAEIPTPVFDKVMENVLNAYFIYKANLNGANFYSMQFSKYENFEFVSGLEKILAPLTLIHLRERQNFDVETISSEVFSCFVNLTIPTGTSNYQGNFLNHFIQDDLAQIEWRMDFFDKLFQKVLPQTHAQFKGISLKNEFFLHGWMIGMFQNVQGLEGIEFVLRIWDLYLLHGETILYCVALVILKVKLYKLNNAPMQSWLDFFSRIKKIKIPQQSHIYHIDSGDMSPSMHELYGDSEIISNESSKMLVPLAHEIIQIFYTYNVPALFKEHEIQQMVAEQKNEVFTKMYLNQDGQF